MLRMVDGARHSVVIWPGHSHPLMYSVDSGGHHEEQERAEPAFAQGHNPAVHLAEAQDRR